MVHCTFALTGFIRRVHRSGNTQAALKGITSLLVLIEGLDQGAAKLGLTADSIRTDVELKLRLAGIKILSTKDRVVGNPCLYINVSVMENGLAANASVEFDQDVRLDRDTSIWLTGATTWESAVLISNPSARGVRDHIKDKIDLFLNAWLRANPKSP